jgi:hypothetical protein
VKAVEADRLMKAQGVEVLIMGVCVHFVTPWGGLPVSGEGFEEAGREVLIAAGEGDPFVVHALASAAIERGTRQWLHQTRVLPPQLEGEAPRRWKRGEEEAVVAEKEAGVQKIRTNMARSRGSGGRL